VASEGIDVKEGPDSKVAGLSHVGTSGLAGGLAVGLAGGVPRRAGGAGGVVERPGAVASPPLQKKPEKLRGGRTAPPPANGPEEKGRRRTLLWRAPGQSPQGPGEAGCVLEAPRSNPSGGQSSRRIRGGRRRHRPKRLCSRRSSRRERRSLLKKWAPLKLAFQK